MEKHRGFIGHKLSNIESLDELLDTAKWIKKHIPLEARYKAENGEGEIIAVIEYGMSNDYSWQESLSSFVPTSDGRFIMRGDIAKARIFSSFPDIKWSETFTGSVKDGTFVYTISGARSESVEFSRSFSIQDAIAAELYDPNPKSPKEISKFWKMYPERQCYYRALGLVARDFFGDVLKNVVIKEEYADYGRPDSVTSVSQEGNVFNLGKVKPTSNDQVMSLKTRPVTTEESFETLKKDEEIDAPSLPETITESEKETEIDSPTLEDVLDAVSSSSAAEAVSYLSAEIPEIIPYIEAIPGRKTIPRIKDIVTAFMTYPTDMNAFMLKTYGQTGIEVTSEKTPSISPEDYRLNWGNLTQKANDEGEMSRSISDATEIYKQLSQTPEIMKRMSAELSERELYHGDIEEALVKAPAELLEELYRCSTQQK